MLSGTNKYRIYPCPNIQLIEFQIFLQPKKNCFIYRHILGLLAYLNKNPYTEMFNPSII